MEMAQYLNVFMDECQEHLHTLNMSLLALENDPDDKTLLEAIFRAAHTLKGAAATMGFNKMANITHAMEDVLSKMRSGEVAITSEVVDLLFECFDLLDALAQGISSGREEEIETSGIVAHLQTLTSSGQEVRQTAPTPARKELRAEYSADEKALAIRAAETGTSLFQVTVRLRPDCLLKGARAFMILRELEKTGDVVRTWPPVKELEDENFDNSFIVGVLSSEPFERVRTAAGSITDVAEVAVEQLDPAAVAVSAGAVSPGKDPGRPATSARPVQIPRLVASPTVRVEIKKLDDLMNLVAELVIQRSQLEQMAAQIQEKNLSEAVDQVGRLTLELRDRVLRARMVQVDNVFSRFPRLVRDLSRELEKEVHINVVGGDTELDRTVIDQIGDPLMHVIRNAVDHGIEHPEARLGAGKPRAGRLNLLAYQESNSVVIVVEDDGKGIDPIQLRDKALELGLKTPEEIAEMSADEWINLIFLSGLTTASRVTDISGRGVGMDVVKKVIEGLGGIISIRSQKGKGTTILIRLPLTLAIVQALLVKVGNEIYAIPSNYIEQTVNVRESDIQFIRGQETTMLRGELLPILRLDRVLRIPGSHLSEAHEMDVVVVMVGERRIGCAVDQLLKQQDVVIKPLGGYIGKIEGIAGGAVLGDGRVALILDTRAFA